MSSLLLNHHNTKDDDNDNNNENSNDNNNESDEQQQKITGNDNIIIDVTSTNNSINERHHCSEDNLFIHQRRVNNSINRMMMPMIPTIMHTQQRHSTNMMTTTTTTKTSTKSKLLLTNSLWFIFILLCLIVFSFHNMIHLLPYVLNMVDDRYYHHHLHVDSTTTNNNAIGCLNHIIIDVNTTRVTHGVLSKHDISMKRLQQPNSNNICSDIKIRRDWTKRRPINELSSVAYEIELIQSNCNHQHVISYTTLDNEYGFGSHLYVWSQALCNVWEYHTTTTTTNDNNTEKIIPRIQTYRPNWLWLDQTYCLNNQSTSPFGCYFPIMEQRCPVDHKLLFHTNLTNEPRNHKLRCNRTKHEQPSQSKKARHNNNNETIITTVEQQQQLSSLEEFRAGTIEYIFSQISTLVIQEMKRQISLLFPLTHGIIPNNLITLHLRWGDKFFEMDLVSISDYINAIHNMIHIINKDKQNKSNDTTNNDNHDDDVHIYLACEDPIAVEQFLNATLIYKNWYIYIDRTVIELNDFRPKRGNRASYTTKNTIGRAGLIALASLLISLESNYYVLTTSSNFSRLINHLRTNIINKECNNCTYMIDLRPGIW